MPTYERADRDVIDLVHKVAKRFHKKLVDEKVTFGVLMAHPTEDRHGNPKGPAITHGGYPALAVVRVTKLKERVQGLADVELTIDADSWEDASDKRKVALIDHELEHLQIVPDKLAGIKRDDAGRPKLKCVLHDWQLGGFEAVARRHASEALEVVHLQALLARPVMTQLKITFPDSEAG